MRAPNVSKALVLSLSRYKTPNKSYCTKVGIEFSEVQTSDEGNMSKISFAAAEVQKMSGVYCIRSFMVETLD